jgi:hypothetical protein
MEMTSPSEGTENIESEHQGWLYEGAKGCNAEDSGMEHRRWPHAGTDDCYADGRLRWPRGVLMRGTGEDLAQKRPCGST